MILTTRFCVAAVAAGLLLGGCAHSRQSLPATWKIDADANVAYPACPACGDVADHEHGVCDCGQPYTIPEKDIDCPACRGTTACAKCTQGAHDCVACDNTGHCPICDGSGSLDGATCPECEGKATCRPCAEGAAKKTTSCMRCDSTGVCVNCDGTGKLHLEAQD